MLLSKKIAVVIPCYNEETQISKVLEGVPAFVDRIYVVDDASTDGTSEIVEEYCKKKPGVIFLVRHQKNAGVGAAIATGYKASVRDNIDITVVMAGDGQMDPDDLRKLIDPLLDNLADYSKGNRFFYLGGAGLKKIPRIRLLGNFILSTVTKIVSGYWHVSDTQCGYTAISKLALQSIDLDGIYPSYGCPNDLLTKLNVANMRVGEVPVKPVYGIGEASKMKIFGVVLPIAFLITRLFFQRMVQKYVLRSGHPLVLAYLFSFFMFGSAIILTVYIFVIFLLLGLIPKVALIGMTASLLLGVQFMLSAFQMDFEYNQDLNVVLNEHRKTSVQR